MSVDTDKRITIMWQRFGQYGKFMKDKKIPTFFNRKITATVMTYCIIIMYHAITKTYPTLCAVSHSFKLEHGSHTPR